MRFVATIAILLAPNIALADEPFVLKNGQRVVFLGDSNTYAGKFIAYLDAYLCTRFPEMRFELVNLGLPSETVSGLSEADHPYPRPNVHDRARRALDLSKPDVVVICYGMNDGIYSPFNQDRFKRYQDGMAKLIEMMERAGAKAILMSPAPFDSIPLRDKVLPMDAPKFSWLRPYDRYDEEVLTKYSEWLVTLRKKKFVVIDAHAALRKHLVTMRKSDPTYRVSGDGIHPNANGHLVIALEILKELRAPAAVKDIAIDVTKDPPTQSEVKIASIGRNSVRFSFALPLPMPLDPGWTPLARQNEDFEEKVNRYSLKIDGMRGYLAIRIGDPKEGGRRVPIRADRIGRGIDLAGLLKLSTDAKTAQVWKLIDEKNRILGPAWLTYIGHKRPDTPKGMPFAEATKKAAALDVEIRKLCKPAEVSLGIGPFGK